MSTGANQDLRGTLALVTGASSGIGAAYAKNLAKRGCNVVLAARRLDRLEALAADLRESHDVEVHPIAADLAKPETPRELFQAVNEFGPLQVLVNNAGVGIYRAFLDGEIETQLKTLDVNSRALMELCWHFGRRMREHGKPSWVSNVASIAAYQSTPGYAAYSGSKYFVRVFSETLAHELRGSNITVSCLCPGATYTEFVEKSGNQITEKGHSVFMTADAVAEIGIRGMLRGKIIVVPGAINKLACFLPRFSPMGISLSLAEKTMARSVRKL
jgi:short-subunit dehydrogenase